MSSEVMGQFEINVLHIMFLKYLLEGNPTIPYACLNSVAPSWALSEKQSASLDTVFTKTTSFTFFHSCMSRIKRPLYYSRKIWFPPPLLIVKLLPLE